MRSWSFGTYSSIGDDDGPSVKEVLPTVEADQHTPLKVRIAPRGQRHRAATITPANANSITSKSQSGTLFYLAAAALGEATTSGCESAKHATRRPALIRQRMPKERPRRAMEARGN
jgi:hypothetical protein